jgi:REP element-mobilizing transposase RayT
LSYLKTYLSPVDTVGLAKVLADPNAGQAEKSKARKTLGLNNFCDRVVLAAYCLMPNHFHFLIKQKDKQAMEILMRSLMTRYTMYFNRRYGRVGTLFQSSYKAVLVESDAQLLHLTRYIHRNPMSGTILEEVSLYEQLTAQPSSYPNYLRKIKQDWVKPDFILQNFSESGFDSYQDFVESSDMDSDRETAVTIAKLTIDDEG